MSDILYKILFIIPLPCFPCDDGFKIQSVTTPIQPVGVVKDDQNSKITYDDSLQKEGKL